MRVLTILGIVAGLIVLFATLGETAPGLEGLVLYFPLNEGPGNTVKDLSGEGNNGKIEGGANWVDGKIGKALEFDGVSGYVAAPDSKSLDFTEAITVELWVRPNAGWANDNWYCLIRKGNIGPEALGVDRPNFFLIQTHPQDGSNQIELAYSHASNNNDWVPSGSALDVGVWYHIAGVVNPSGGEMLIYINGELDAEKAIPDEPLEPDDNEVWIANGWAFFNGVIDEVAVYNRALTVEEIKQDMGGIKAVVSLSGKLANTWAKIKVVP